MNDRELLQAFARQKSEAAFQELVRRHGKLVYSCARQRVGDPHAAQDITQSVFLALAIQAATLPAGTILTGWLYRVTQFTAAKHQRREHNRQEREMRASEHQQIHGTTDDTAALWEEIRPHVASALDELSTTDRNAVLLRFYEQSSYRQLAEALQVSEEAAKKRVNRALEPLRRFFTKKGIGIGTGALATVLGARAAEAIPAALESQTVQTAIAGMTGTMAATETLMLAKGAGWEPAARWTIGASVAKGQVDLFLIGEDLGTQRGPTISLDLYRKHLQPQHQRFVDLGREFGIPVMIHCCGSSSWAFDDFIAMGISVIDTLQPEAKDMAPAYLKNRYGDRLAFHGMIATAGPVAHAPIAGQLAHRKRAGDVRDRPTARPVLTVTATAGTRSARRVRPRPVWTCGRACRPC